MEVKDLRGKSRLVERGISVYDSACSPVNGLAGAIRAAGFA
jgi:hypothetical protein